MLSSAASDATLAQPWPHIDSAAGPHRQLQLGGTLFAGLAGVACEAALRFDPAEVVRAEEAGP